MTEEREEIEAYFKRNRIATEGGVLNINAAVFEAAKGAEGGHCEEGIIKVLREEHAQSLDGSDTVEYEILNTAQEIVFAYRNGQRWDEPTSFECLLVP